MKTSFVFLADGFEEIEALATIDVMRRAGMPVVTVSINPTPQVTGAHGVPVLADALITACDLSDAEWLICPGGMPGASNLAACQPLTDALVDQYVAATWLPSAPHQPLFSPHWACSMVATAHAILVCRLKAVA